MEWRGGRAGASLCAPSVLRDVPLVLSRWPPPIPQPWSPPHAPPRANPLCALSPCHRAFAPAIPLCMSTLVRPSGPVVPRALGDVIVSPRLALPALGPPGSPLQPAVCVCERVVESTPGCGQGLAQSAQRGLRQPGGLPARPPRPGRGRRAGPHTHGQVATGPPVLLELLPRAGLGVAPRIWERTRPARAAVHGWLTDPKTSWAKKSHAHSETALHPK